MSEAKAGIADAFITTGNLKGLAAKRNYYFQSGVIRGHQKCHGNTVLCLPTWLRLELIYGLERLVFSVQAASFSCWLPTARVLVSEIFLYKLST